MAALVKAEGHQINAAKLLGVHRNSLMRDIRSLNLGAFLKELRRARRKKPVTSDRAVRSVCREVSA